MLTAFIRQIRTPFGFQYRVLVIYPDGSRNIYKYHSFSRAYNDCYGYDRIVIKP